MKNDAFLANVILGTAGFQVGVSWAFFCFSFCFALHERERERKHHVHMA